MMEEYVLTQQDVALIEQVRCLAPADQEKFLSIFETALAAPTWPAFAPASRV